MMILTRGMLKIIREWNQPGFYFIFCSAFLFKNFFLTWPPLSIDPGDVLRMLHVAPERERSEFPSVRRRA